jgi:hypothetical protein
MVQRLPGFVFDDGSSVRGLAGAAGNVLIDGQRPASKTDDLTSILKRIPAGQVARIDLIRGAQPGIDMQGKTVVANVIRKSGQGVSGAVSIGQYSTGDGYTDPQAKIDATWRFGDRQLEASASTFKGHDNSAGSGAHLVLGPDGRVQDAGPLHATLPNSVRKLAGAYETPLAGGRLRANLTWQSTPSEFEQRDAFRLAGLQVLHTKQGQEDGEFGLRFERPLPASLTLELFGLQHLSRNSTRSLFTTASDLQDFDVDGRGGESVGRAVLHWRPSGGLTVDAGGEGAYNFVTTRTRFADNGLAIRVPAADVRVEEKRAERFLTASWRPTATLAAEAGVRVETSTISSTGDVVLSKTLTFPKPRVVLTWSPDPRDQLRLRVEREVGQLDFHAFVASGALNGAGVLVGNPDLRPQQDWVYEAAYERRLGKDGVVSLTVQQFRLKDVIDRVPIVGASGVFDAPGNIGAGTQTNLIASFTLPLDRLGLAHAQVRALGTWRRSEVTDPTTGVKRRISGQGDHDAELHFTQDLPARRTTWGVDVTFGNRQAAYRFDEVDIVRTNTVATVYAEWKPGGGWALFVGSDTGYWRFHNLREVTGGLRGRDPLALTDLQDHRFGPVVFTRLRKTF